MPTQTDLEYRLSGGTANTAPAASLGGAMSTATPGGFIRSNNVSVTTPISGITVLDAPQSNVGSGVLEYIATGTVITWAPFGAASGVEVNIGTTGLYTLYGLDGLQALRISVVAGSLPISDSSTAVVVTRNAGGLLDTVSAANSISGHVDYRCFYILNVSATAINSVRVWISSIPSGSDIAVGLDPAGTSGNATTIANETTAPAGVTFSTPTTAASGLFVATVAASGKFAVWIRRTVPVGSEVSGTSTTPITFSLQIAYT